MKIRKLIFNSACLEYVLSKSIKTLIIRQKCLDTTASLLIWILIKQRKEKKRKKEMRDEDG